MNYSINTNFAHERKRSMKQIFKFNKARMESEAEKLSCVYSRDVIAPALVLKIQCDLFHNKCMKIITHLSQPSVLLLAYKICLLR